MNIIEAQDVRFAYQSTPVLDHITFSIREGEFIGVIGSNGAGKSTLLRLLLGELAPQGGRIYLFGTPATRFQDWQRIGYVPQNGASRTGRFPATALEVVLANLYRDIGLFRLPGKGHRERALEALESVGIGQLGSCMIDRLSGGQLQRVLIARALVARPQLLILDEPTAGLDGESASSLCRLLVRLNRQGITVLMVTHDVQHTAPFIHRALCIEDSSLVVLDRNMLEEELSHRHVHPHRLLQHEDGED